MTIALLAALGLASKPLLTPLSRSLLSTFLIPGGVIFGGLYMMWLALARGIVGKTGSATLAAFIQGIVAVALGLSPVGGLLTAVLYVLPGASVDLAFLIPGQGRYSRLSRFLLSCVAANVMGIVLVALLRGIVHWPLILLVTIGAISGCLGGLLAFVIAERIPFRSNPHLDLEKKKRDELSPSR